MNFKGRLFIAESTCSTQTMKVFHLRNQKKYKERHCYKMHIYRKINKQSSKMREKE